MRTVWRVAGCLAGVAGLTGTALCVAGAAGCWFVQAQAVARTNRAFGRVTAALDAAGADVARAGDTLTRTREQLNARRLRPEEVPETVARLAEVRRIVSGATDAARVAEGFATAVAELPGTGRLEAAAGDLRDAAAGLSELGEIAERVIDRLAPATAAPAAAPDPAGRFPLDAALARAGAAVAAGRDRLGAARDRVEDLRARLVRAFTLIAAGLTFGMTWIAAGQLSLLAHGVAAARSQVRPPAGQQVSADAGR